MINSFKNIDTLSYDERIRLESKSFVQSITLPEYREMFGSNEMEVRASVDMFRRVQLDFMNRIAKQTLESTLKKEIKRTVDVPTIFHSTYPSAWQMFKDQYMPKWFKNKFPVKKEEVVINQTVEVGIMVEIQNVADVYYPQIKITDQPHYVHVYEPRIVSVREI